MPSADEVNDVPDNFKKYIADNAERIAGWSSVPYYIKDNTGSVVVSLCEDTGNVKENISRRHVAAKLLNEDKNYKDVKYDSATGGLKAIHIGHNFDKVGGEYEKNACDVAYSEGHAIILGNEYSNKIGQRFTEGLFDGLRFEVMGCETATDNNYLRGLCHCAEKRTTQVVILNFPKGGFDDNKLQRALGRYRGLEKLNDGQYIDFERVVCIQDGKIVYDKPYTKGAGGSTSVVHPPHVEQNNSTAAKVSNNLNKTKTKEQLLAEEREKRRILTLERANNRHAARTKEEIDDIQDRWVERQARKIQNGLYADEIVKIAKETKDVGAFLDAVSIEKV